ncbi:exodeoxyribonuclease VII large subunit [Candidatus Woesearchaeota archaeon]|nr:exodeoxyribonuclease VII large subunit [Nanoarchaeota archaeon]MCB9370385.1 exodeoxyribonuclease VII large subunit [Candidatus Woesearchaeota archaeon]USN44905.1 MAG: exodeoxyribonuclease VII large subunit [Candidatus Woesearchaeota archaeon]
MFIEPEIIRLEAGEVVYERGRELFEENSLQGPFAFSLVEDSLLGKISFKTYQCSFELSLQSHSLLQSHCTCPYFEKNGLICKHLVCVLLQGKVCFSQLFPKNFFLLGISEKKELVQSLLPKLSGWKLDTQKENTLSVSELTRKVKTLLEGNLHLQNIYVEGEISSYSPNNSGHIYFSLKDEGALLSCAKFKGSAKLLFQPKTGDKVIVKGSVCVYEPRGSYQFIVQEMKKAGEGDLYAKFLELKNGLEQKGYFDQAHKKKIPAFPRCIGVVSSETGAVIRDIIHTIRRRFPAVEILLCPCSVQGEGSEKSVLEALQTLSQRSEVDTIIIARGGGSLEDLWTFNSEKLAKEIYSCKTPIISAIGHETDFTICDFVADLRAPTPTAAAELATPELSTLFSFLESSSRQLRVSLKRNFESKILRLAHLESDLVNSFEKYCLEQKHLLDAANEKLRLLSVESVLAKGYSLTVKGEKEGGFFLSSSKDISEGEKITTFLKEGKIESIISKKIEK